MKKSKKPRAPKTPTDFRPATQQWIKQIREAWDLEEHQKRILLAAAEAWDRHEEARELLARHGLTYKNKHGDIKPHPAVAIERDSRLAFVRCVRELNLDAEPPESRPPGLKFSGKKGGCDA